MLLEPLWAALRFVQWEDTIRFHVRLFRCFLLGFLDAHSELVVLSQGAEWMLAVLSQRLAGVGLMHDAGHLHESVSHQASPLGRYNDATIRCPPKRRYEATLLPSFTMPTDPAVPFPLFIFSHPVNITHGLYDEPMPSAVAFGPSGSGWVPGGYGSLPTGMVGFILFWLVTLAIVISRYASTGSGPAQVICRTPKGAMESTANSSKQVIRPLVQDRLLMHEVTQGVVATILEDISHQASMPGAWLDEPREQSVPEMLEDSVFDTMPWTLPYSCIQTGMKVWTQFSSLTLIFEALFPWNRGSSDIIKRKSEDACSPVRRGLDAGVSVSAELNGSKQQGGALDYLSFESGLSIGSFRGSTMATLNRRCGPSAICDVAIKDPDPTRTTTLDVVYGDTIGLTFALMASSSVDHLFCPEYISSDVDESASDNGCDETENEGLFGVGTQRADISALERKDEYRVLGRRQDDALPDIGCPLSLRRARSSGYLWKKCDMFDNDDEGTGDDSYWTEQVNARLSGVRDSRRESCRYDSFDVSSWPREGREDETDNWRIRSSQVTHVAAHEKTSDAAARCQADGDSAKLSRYSSPPLNVDDSLPHHAGSGNGPQGIYVVPQKRGRGRCWPPVSDSRPSDRSSGLGFFPFRKPPSLLTSQGWRPGCLYVPDPPEDEARQADAWWDSLSSVGSCGSASGAGHGWGIGLVTQDAAEQGPLFSRDSPDGPASWRDRHENDPASRRFISAHRRAMTEG